VRRGRLGEREEVRPVRRPRRRLASRLREAGEGVRAHRLEHGEARLAVDVVAPHEEALVAERRHAIEHVRRVGVGRRRRRDRRAASSVKPPAHTPRARKSACSPGASRP
jgi:hypothetical protein